MGLDLSHDAFHGAYSAFNRLREHIVEAIGGTWPNLLDANPQWTYDENVYDMNAHPALHEFLCHPDCDGEIAPDVCALLANDLEELLPKMPTTGTGHLDRPGGVRAVVQQLIDGCRRAHAAGEPLDFH